MLERDVEETMSWWRLMLERLTVFFYSEYQGRLGGLRTMRKNGIMGTG